MRDVRVNKWLDLLDRAGWTAIQAAGAAIITALATDGIGWEEALTFVGTATLLAVCKVVVAQRTGVDDLGAAVPGHVLEDSSGGAPSTPSPSRV